MVARHTSAASIKKFHPYLIIREILKEDRELFAYVFVKIIFGKVQIGNHISLDLA